MGGNATAQTISGGPITGAIFDTSTHSIRSIMGLPGAAYLGAAAASTWDLAMPSPDGKRAVALRGAELSLIADLSQPDAATDLGGVIQTVDRVVWSADSSTAVLYSSRSNQLQRVTGLNGTPAIQPSLDLSGVGGVLGWAISPDGGSLAWSTSTSVYLLGGSAVSSSGGSLAPVSLGAFSDPRALAFASDGASLFVFDRAAQKISRVATASGATLDSFAASTDAANRVASPARSPGVLRRTPPVRQTSQPDIRDLAATTDGAKLLAARSDAVCVYDLSRQTPDHCDSLDVSPASIQAIGPGVFVLNYPRTAGLPVWLWDGSAGSVFFVPSGRSVTNVPN
jgi:hypothetical protein